MFEKPVTFSNTTKMDWFDRIDTLTVELTSHCNASCPSCMRNDFGGPTLPYVDLDHMSMELWERIIHEDLKDKQMKQLQLNGNWGDAMMHPQVIEFVEMWIDKWPESYIVVSTNGSLRNKKFWETFAKTLVKSRWHVVEWAVDGLKGTHEMYRRNTNFDKIIQNIKYFNNAGGCSEIVTTCFEHNKGQIKLIERLAKNIGCSSFRLRNSHEDKILKIGTDRIAKHVIEPYRKEWISRNDFTTRPEDEDFHFTVKRDDGLKTKCPWYNDAEIQIDPWGTAWPCCHISPTGNETYQKGKPSQNKRITNIDEIDIIKQNNLSNESLKDVLNNDFFSSIEQNVEEGNWPICVDNCGVKNNG